MTVDCDSTVLEDHQHSSGVAAGGPVLQSGVEIPYRPIKTNIADSLNIIVQIERRPGTRFVSEVLEIRGYQPEADQYDLYQVYSQSGKY
jgi:Flp pilus assembly CpaF family ATPase